MEFPKEFIARVFKPFDYHREYTILNETVKSGESVNIQVHNNTSYALHVCSEAPIAMVVLERIVQLKGVAVEYSHSQTANSDDGDSEDDWGQDGL